MPYSINPVNGAYVLAYVPNTGFPTSFRYMVMSAWFEFKPDISGFQMQAIGYDPGPGAAGAFRGVTINSTYPSNPTTPRVLTVSLGDGAAHGPGGSNPYTGIVGFDITSLVAGVYYNILVSIDSVSNVVQCYVNDAPLTIVPTPFWDGPNNLVQPSSGAGGSSNGSITISAENSGPGTNPCVADAFWYVPTVFFDLSSTPNRRLFINADLTPVFLGSNGQLPFGTTPQVYATVPPSGIASDFRTNHGITGGTFAASGAQALCNPVSQPVIFDGLVRKTLCALPVFGCGPFPLFPILPVGFPVKLSVLMDTTLGTTKSLREMRYAQRVYPLWDIELLFEELRDQTQNQTVFAPFAGFVQYEQLVQLWLSMYGQTNLFAFDAPWDDSRSNQLIGVGDGTTTTFTIYRTWGTGDTATVAPIGLINTVFSVGVGGIIQPTSAYSTLRNKITFAVAPALGANIQMTFSFYYLCRPVEDQQDWEEFAQNRWAVKSLKFRAVFWP